jgi:hypothetical protein
VGESRHFSPQRHREHRETLVKSKAKAICSKIFSSSNFDGLEKKQKSRRSREGGSPELVVLTGFPLSRE